MFLCDSPQQNGVIEHKHWHILSLSTFLSFQAHLPSKFWEDCILTAVYLINRSRNPIYKIEDLLNSSFLSNLLINIFVFLGVYALSLLLHDRSKFSPRVRRCIFLGYPYNIKGCKFYDLTSHTTFISWNVIFHKIFPFQPYTSSISTFPLSNPSAALPLTILENHIFFGSQSPSFFIFFSFILIQAYLLLLHITQNWWKLHIILL